jgi:predicted RNA-binding protein with PIN domain
MQRRVGESERSRGAAARRAVLETAGFVVAFLAFGLAWAGLAQHRSPATPYAVGMSDADRRAAEIWLVDGYNVLCAGLLGGQDRSEWWTERRRGELLRRLETFEDGSAELWVVFDGSRAAPEPATPTRVRSVFAAPADDWILTRAAEGPPGVVVVVTADRRVAARARRRGARVVAPTELLSRCPV